MLMSKNKWFMLNNDAIPMHNVQLPNALFTLTELIYFSGKDSHQNLKDSSSNLVEHMQHFNPSFVDVIE